MPQDQLENVPWLSYWLGVALTAVNLPEACSAYQRAYEGFLSGRDKIGQAMATAGVLETYYLEMDNLNLAERWLPIVDELFAEEPAFPTPGAAARVYGVLAAFMTWVKPSHSLLPIAVERLEALLQADLPANRKVSAAGYLVEYYAFAACPEKIRPFIEIVEPLLRRADVTPVARASWLLRAAWRYYSMRGDFAQVDRMTEEALAIATENGFHFLLTLIYGAQADLALDLSEFEAAAAIIERKHATLPKERKQALGRYYSLN